MKHTDVNRVSTPRSAGTVPRIRSPWGRAVVGMSGARGQLGLVFLLGVVSLVSCKPLQASPSALPPAVEASASQPLSTPTPETGAAGTSEPTLSPIVAATEPQGPLPENLVQSDSQGAVEVDVTPIDLDGGGDGTLAFEVGMNTHSVDLSMDLAELSTLQADNGVTVQALDWSGGSGHHVRGVLRFPANASDGRTVMAGASHLVLIIRNVDAQERTFEWKLPAAQ